ASDGTCTRWEIPCIFPRFTEFPAETGSLQTGPTANGTGKKFINVNLLPLGIAASGFHLFLARFTSAYIFILVCTHAPNHLDFYARFDYPFLFLVKEVFPHHISLVKRSITTHKSFI